MGPRGIFGRRPLGPPRKEFMETFLSLQQVQQRVQKYERLKICQAHLPNLRPKAQALVALLSLPQAEIGLSSP